MPRSKEIPEDVRKKVVEAYESGKGYKLISKDVGLPKTTVRAILHKWKRFGTVVNLPRSGRPSKISPGARREIIREAMKSPFTTSKDLQATLASSNICVHHSTIRRIMGVHRRPTLSSIDGSMVLAGQQEDGMLSASEGSSQKNEEKQALKKTSKKSDIAKVCDIKDFAGHNKNKEGNKEKCTVETTVSAAGADVETALTNHNCGKSRKCAEDGIGADATPANCNRGGANNSGFETTGVDGVRRSDNVDSNSAFINNNWNEEMDFISKLTFT